MAEYVYTDKDGETITVDEHNGCLYVETFRAVVIPTADVPRLVAEICAAVRLNPADVLKEIGAAR